MRALLIAFVSALVFFRAYLFIDFAVWSWCEAKGHADGRGKRTWTLLRMTSAQLGPKSTPVSGAHKAYLDEDSRTFEIMLVGGSIGIAAWAGLFAASAGPPVNRLSGLTLYLLFAGTVCLLAGPLIWRSRGLYLTALGRKSATELGFSLIVFSLASVIVDLRIPVAMVSGLVIAGIVVLRDLFATVDCSRIHSNMDSSQ